MTLSAPAHSRLRLRRLSAGLARVVALAFAVVLLAVTVAVLLALGRIVRLDRVLGEQP